MYKSKKMSMKNAPMCIPNPQAHVGPVTGYGTKAQKPVPEVKQMPPTDSNPVPQHYQMAVG